MTTPSKTSGWLPNLIGPLDLQGDGEQVVTRRATINFIGVTVADNPDFERTDIDVGATRGTWLTAYEVDFTAPALTTATANGAFTIDGKTWTVQNFVKSSVMSVGGANGMRIKCTTASSGMTATLRQAPMFRSPALSVLLAGLVPDDMRIGIRISTNVLGWTRNVNALSTDLSHDSTAIMLDTGDTVALGTPNSQRYEGGQRHSDAAQRDFMRLMTSNNLRASSNPNVARNAAHDCIQLEIPYLGGAHFKLNNGVYAAGFPTKWTQISTVDVVEWYVIPMTQLADAYICLFQSAADAAGTSEGKFGRLKIEYMQYTP